MIYIKAGKTTFVSVDGMTYRLSDADGFCQFETGCTGVLKGVLNFTLYLTKCSGGSVMSLSFSAVNGKKVRVGDITLLDFAEQKSEPAPDRAVYCFRDSLFDQYVKKASDNGGVHQTKPMCLVYDLVRKESFFAAQQTFDKNLFEFDLVFNKSDSVLKSLVCRIPDSGYVAGEETVSTDQLFLKAPGSERPYDILCS